ncbi:MAG: hypothetical protein BECKG1743D_GA0114223_102771 [Candidatus Kentron sp. G]|nr:MAG: hypothetical protein BECKG1743F_GA0114225_102352 [Candidatus Kentron sp. G]VFM99685.1 MAG: hypothetical protein BECKG1743E_GA0114224_102741 [Candidatus Kentron sp. G]VFN01405.1 MAG: hypothetical protein BECKG1743D_GA0114223_102771 [Candidatus Kentron sp. G]
MLIYLDTCCIQRPKDDRSDPRNHREAEAILAVLDLIESGAVRLLSSPVLELEIRQIPDSERRRRVHAMGIISLADTVAKVSSAAYTKAKEIEPKCKEIKLSEEERNDCPGQPNEGIFSLTFCKP